MKTSLKNAMRLSQSTIRTGQPINDVLLAEQQIATSSPDAFALHRSGAPASFAALWQGLRFAATGSHAEACREFLRASELGCSHWRVGWYLAQSAKVVGDVPLVDEACAAVLRANPEFWFARELPKHARGYYAQGEQDKLIEDFFRQHPPRCRVFVEVGAFDGVHYSNVRRLVEKHGWTGISIEPVAKNFAKLTASYREYDVRCVKACVSDREGEVELNVSTYPHLPEWGSDVASVSGESSERWSREYGAVWTKEKVPARTLTSILDEGRLTDVDFLSIDAEGHDLEVLRGLDFERFQPQLIVVEYGNQREAIRELLEAKGYTLRIDNKQDLFMVKPRNLSATSVPREESRVSVSSSPSILPEGEVSAALQKLNPHLLKLNTLPVHAGVRRGLVDPHSLVTPERFDLLAKHLYARYREAGTQTDWAKQVYRAHIAAFSDGTFREGDGRKNSIDDYFRSFESTLDSVRSNGFNSDESLVPVGRNHVIIDGAHRVAACLLHRKSVDCLVFERDANRFDAGYFLGKGLPRPHADALAIEYCQLRPDTFIVHLFPKAEGRDEDVRSILREFGAIVYEKELRLRNNGPWWLVRQLYRGEKWIGSWNDNFAGARRDAQTRFDGKSPLRIFVFQCDDLAKVREAKARIRALYGHGNYSSHVNDTHEETLRLARLFFNANGIHFLNNARPKFFDRFERHFDRYRQWLLSTGADPERFCVDGSAVMAAYGLRDAQDLDVLHFGDASFSAVEPEVNSHNAHVHHHVVGRDELIYNPEHYFHYDGLKFVSLPAIRAMKAKRGEGKDQKDVALMDTILTERKPVNPAASPFVVKFEDGEKSGTTSPASNRPGKAPVRLYYIPNGNDYHIAALLNDLFVEVKPFGCRDVQDYIDRRILAYKTPNASQQLWEEVSAMRPDLVYVESGKNIEPATLQRIRTELGIPVTMWFGDACVNEQFIERLMAYAPCVDRQIVVDRGVAEVAAKRGLRNVEFIPFFGYDHYFRPLNAPKTLEILFSGKSYDGTFAQYPFAKERLAFVRRVNSEFGRRLAVVGENWEHLGLANYVPDRVPEWEVNELNNHAKIVLAFDAAHVREFTSCRTYHALLGRSFVLIRKFPGIENLFVNGEHLVWFETADEGIELLRHYLDHPEERERIAEGGYQHVHRNGWMFSNVVRYLVNRGLKRESSLFEQIHAPYSQPLPQRVRRGLELVRPERAADANSNSAPTNQLSAAAQGCLEQAETFFNQGRFEDARDWLERALDLEPNHFELLTAFARLSLQLNALPAAETALAHAARLRPEDAAIQVLLASAQYKQGNVEAFESTLSSVLRRNPAEPAALRFLAELNLENGRFKDAANGYFKLIQLNESDLDSLLGLGVCFFKTGDIDSARMTFQRVLEISPGHALATENLQAINGSNAQQSKVTLAEPLISAIVSTFNSEHFMRKCLEDLEAQTIADKLEIIVIDSGSPQNERAIVEEFQQRYSNIRYLRTERETIYAAWNRGVQMARGKYLTSANTDDRHRPDAFEKMVAALESRPDCVLAYADMAICETVHPDNGYPEVRGYFRWPEFDVRLMFRDCYMGPQPVWRRAAHERYGLFDPSFKSSGDYEFWLRMARTEKFLHVPEVLGLYWNTPHSAGHMRRDITRAEADQAREKHWPKEWGERPPVGFTCVKPSGYVAYMEKTVAALQSQLGNLMAEKGRLEMELNRWIGGSSSPATPTPAPANASAAFALLQEAQEQLKARNFAEANALAARYASQASLSGLTHLDARKEKGPLVSVIIVSYGTGPALLDCIRSLDGSPSVPHEVIVVDNGGNESVHADLAGMPILHVQLPVNIGPAEARNIGARYSRGSILSFLDDDAVAESGYLGEIVRAFETYDICALRGKVVPKTNNPNNARACHYNLGETPVPSDLDTEGNSAVLARVWRETDGMNPLLFGGEGLELSYRIARAHGQESILYWPGAVIRHDYAFSDDKLNRKQARHELMRAFATSLHSDLFEYHARLTEYLRSDASRRAGNSKLRRGPSAISPSGGDTTTGTVQPRTGDPLISICVPVYNRERYVTAALNSALRQTYRNFEVVVVDDGSTDKTRDVIAGLASDRIRLVRQKHAGGPTARNRCVEEARGEFIVWLDSDDVIMPDTLEHYVQASRREPHVDIFYGDLRQTNEQLTGGMIWKYTDYGGWKEALLGDSLVINRIPNGFSMIRRRLIKDLGGYNPKFTRAHDYEFWTRAVAEAEVRHLDRVVGIYRVHKESLSMPAGRVDTQHEAKAVRQMLERNSLQEVLPWCFGEGLAETRSEASAWRIATLLQLNYGDAALAAEYLRRSIASDPHPDSVALQRLLVEIHAREFKSVSGRPMPAPPESEFHRTVSDAVRHFKAGQAKECARACARLTELRPEALETMVLVGSSLLRWGDPRNARAAFKHLIELQIEQSYCEAAEAEARIQFTATPTVSRTVHDYAARTLGVESIPIRALQQSIEFIGLVGRADAPGRLLRSNRAKLTPLFYALVGMTDAEVVESLGKEFATNLTTARKALLANASGTPAGKRRQSGYSFCVITNGMRPAKLGQMLDSIRAAGLQHYEIIIAGRVTQEIEGVRTIDLGSAAESGRTSVLRNAAGNAATFDHIVFCDDDLIFNSDFGDSLRRFGEGYDAMAVRLLSPDGTRMWDWACVGGVRGQVLLNYWESNPDVYLTSGVLVVKTHVYDAVRWDEQRGYYQGEDVDFTRRLQAGGFSVVYNPFAQVTHNDDRYTVVGRKVMRLDDVLKRLEIACRSENAAVARQLVPVARQLSENYPDEQRELRGMVSKYDALLSQTTPTNNTVRESMPSGSSVNVAWDGSFLDLGSLSHVNRELTAALSEHSQVQLTRLGKNAVPKPLARMKSIIECARTLRAQPPKPAQVTVRHAWPPNWERPANGAWVLIQPWEFGSLPKEWVQNVSRVDEVWVPSDYVRRVYVDSGVDARKVHVVPNGIDAEVFRPDVKPMALATKKSFKFLFVGGTILRKGPDVLLKAFLESFTAQDDVCLVIKDFGGQSVYAGQTFEAQVKAAQAKPNAPEILYLNEELPPESLPGLYAACDCLVHPYRGEGFGLPVLEAMACGLPVVVTAGGSTDDFTTDEFAYRIPSIRKIFGKKVSDMELVKPGWMLEPDHTALVERLKWIAAHRDEARTLGARASEYVRREWTWERAARIAAARLVLLNERPRPVAPAPGSRKPKTIALPACGKLGHLGEARERFRAGKLLPAWNATVAALKARPYHPEAFLLLAEIALAAGDSKQAKELGDRACRLAPKWKPARQFAKARHPKSAMAKIELPALPRAIIEGYSKPRLSVFLITKNEERFIGQCLESVRDIATQIVVMDTGSTDWTKTIAERFGAEIATFDWCDDFSAARNAALEKVTGDWVLMLDADEELMPDQKERLRQMMNDPSAIAWRMPLIDKGREDEGVSQVPRLFRNAPGLFYVGRIHEQIFSSVEVRRLEWGLENKFGDATLLHHGYTQEMVQSRDKIARNLRLLQLAVEELPDEPNLLMNLGLELVRDGRLNEGLEQYATAFVAMSALPKEQVTPELRESLLTQYASHLVSSKRSTEVVRVLQSPLAKLGGLTASMHWLLGLAFIEQKQFAEGAAQMRECLAKRDKPSYAPVNRNILKGGPNHCLALCLSAMKQREPANRAFEAALKEDPAARSVRFDYARFLVEGGDEVDALKWLHQLAMEEPGDLRVWQFGGQVALSRPDYLEFAGDWTGEALKQHPDQATIISQRATALMFTGDAEAASTLWHRVELTPSVQAALVLCAVLAGRSGAPINHAQAAAVNQEFINWYRKLLEFNAESLVATLHQRMEALRRMVPAAARLIESAMNEVNAVPSK